MLNRQMKRGPLVLAVLCLALSALGPAAASAATVAEGRATFELAPGLLGALRTQEARLVAVKPARGGRNALNFPLAGGRLEKSGAGRLRLQGSLEVTKQGRRARLARLVPLAADRRGRWARRCPGSPRAVRCGRPS